MSVEIIAVVIVVLMAIVAVSYFLYDYFNYKKTVLAEIKDADEKLAAEKSDRLSNLKFVVDQVNTVNQDMFGTLSSNVTDFSSQLTSQKSGLTGLSNGLDAMFNYTSAGSNISLEQLPGSVSPDLNLLHHMTTTMGLTIKDVEGVSTGFAMCSKEDPKRCIRFPDDDGNTMLTSMNSKGAVISDAPLVARDGFAVNNKDNSMAAAFSPLPVGLGMKILSSKVAITNSFDFTTPDAFLHVHKQNADINPVFVASIGDLQAVSIDATGAINTTQPIILKNGAVETGRITATADGLEITAANLKVNGNVTMTNLNVEGTSTVQSQPVATVQPPATA